MAPKILDEKRVLALHAAGVAAGLTARRTELLSRIDGSFVANMTVLSSPSAQLLMDLNALCVTLIDDSVPIVLWLENALAIAGTKSSAKVFIEALRHLGHEPPARPIEQPAKRVTRTDVVILTALQDELTAVLALEQGWEEKRDAQGFRYFHRTFERDGGGTLGVATAWIGAMGQDVDTVLRGQQLLAELDPRCLAMCGVCAGRRGKTELGDIVVANKLYVYDHGKMIAGADRAGELHHDIETHGPGQVWKMDAALFGRTFDVDALTRERPRSLESQRWWLLRAIHAHENDGAEAPDKHPDRKVLCPDWTRVLTSVRQANLVAITAGKLRLTEEGSAVVAEHLLLNPDGLPVEPKVAVLSGAMATGRTVQQDPSLFERLSRIQRDTIAVDMEGAAVAAVAGRFGKQSIVVKGVSDHADHDKDDRFKAFAGKASATFLLSFLREHLDSDPAHAR